MKIRNGFVSNSSSSNFIILCRDIPMEQAQEDHCAIGDYIVDGIDYFTLTKEMAELVREGKTNLQIIESIEEGENEISFEEDNMKLLAMLFKKNNKLKIISLEVDYHTTDNLEDFKKRYCK